MDQSVIDYWEGSPKGILNKLLEYINDRISDLDEFKDIVQEGINVDDIVVNSLNRNKNKIEEYSKLVEDSMYKIKIEYFIAVLKDFIFEVGKITGQYSNIIEESKYSVVEYKIIKKKILALFKRVELQDKTLKIEDIEDSASYAVQVDNIDKRCRAMLRRLLDIKQEGDELIDNINNYVKKKFDDFIRIEQERVSLSLEDEIDG